MKKYIMAFTGMFVFGLATSWAASADVIADRQARFKANNASMRAIGAALGAGDVQTIKSEASKIAEWAKVMPDYFPKGSSGGKASVKDDLWDNFDVFRTQANENYESAIALIAAAESGDMDKTKGALIKVGGTCKACHQNFKSF